MNKNKAPGLPANPEVVRQRLEKLAQAAPRAAEMKDRMALIHGLLAGSDFLFDWLCARPAELYWLLGEGLLDRGRTERQMKANLAALIEEHPPEKALRYFKHRELCRICARELSGAATLEVAAKEWSFVADVAIDAAVRWAEENARRQFGEPIYTELTGSEPKLARFAVIGMGKLGAQELNISSDVDLIYIHSSDNGVTTGPEIVHIHEFFVRVARAVSKILGDVTEDGFVFRVDLDLRPEGPAGELTNSVGAMEIYYESYGRQWERQALIKARHCGGGKAVTSEILKRLEPFVYRKYMDEAALREVADIKKKIDQTLAGKKTVKNPAHNIKLGRGGIREIEFTVQALQLLYGGRNRSLRQKATLKALKACHSSGLLSIPHYKDLKKAYLFLRMMENRLQYAQNVQTHNIPPAGEKRELLARLMGFEGDQAGVLMMEEQERIRNRVREIFELFTLKKEKEAESFPAPLNDEEAIGKWLDSLQFDHPVASARALRLLRDGAVFSHPSEKSIRAFDSFGPKLVSLAASTAWPDHVILGLSNYVEAKGSRDQLYAMLDEKEKVMEILAAIFSSSESMTAAMLRQPDILERLLVTDSLEMPPDRGKYRMEFSRLGGARSDGEKLAILNSFKTAESLRLGLRLLFRLCGQEELMMGLTLLAEEYLAAVISMARESLPDQPEGAGYCLVAGGKLGRREMNFGSDLDLLVFFSHGKQAAGEAESGGWVTRLVQKVIKLCGEYTTFGIGYQLDMRLRPEGESSPLAAGLETSREYYKGRASTWERLALVGARPVAGDPETSAGVMDMLNEFVSHPVTQAEAGHIIFLRRRMAKEKIRKGAVDIKFGFGGLVEIEFICQWLCIEKGFMPPDGAPFTMAVLREAGRRKWLEPDVSAKLAKAYGFLRAVEDTIRMNREQALHVISQKDKGLLRRLARVEPNEGGKDIFMDNLKAVMNQVKDVWEEFSYGRARGLVDMDNG